MEDDYGLADLRPYPVGGSRPFFPPPPPPDFIPSSGHRSLTTDNLPYYMLNFAPNSTGHGGGGGFEMEGAGGAGRWPRQETLTLLEIRSRLDPRFKEANQKGPLWDEVSRIMCEEFGYQRNGKKCREKFENLYKYYKKTKAGRQDGKHYRFFRQLEALYGGSDTQTNNNNNNNNFRFDNNNNNNNNMDESVVVMLPNNENQESYTSLVSISNSSDSDSSDEDEDTTTKGKKKMGKRNLEAKIKESIDSQMKVMMERQEVWMDKMMRKMEENEQERVSREEQWRRMDDERIERERRTWAGEKAWIQARDAEFMDAFAKMAGKGGQSRGDYNSSPREEELMASFGGHYYNLMKMDDHVEGSRSGGGGAYDQSMSEQGTTDNAMSMSYFGGDHVHGYGRI